MLKLILVVDILNISFGVAASWMQWDPSSDKSTWGQEMWFRKWLGVVKQQTITWANVDPYLCYHMATMSLVCTKGEQKELILDMRCK